MQSNLICQYIRKCVLIRHIFCESFVKLCPTKHKCRSFLWHFFRHKAMFSTCPNIESRNQKFGLLLIDILGHYISWYRLQMRYRPQTTDNRQNSKITERQTFLRILWNTFIYHQFGSGTFFSGSRKNSVNIGFLER